MPQSYAVSHMTLVRARAGCSAQVHACLKQLIEPTLKTPGCLHFALQHCDSDPLLWHVAGYWQDQCAMQAYFNSPLMDVFSTLLNPERGRQSGFSDLQRTGLGADAQARQLNG